MSSSLQYYPLLKHYINVNDLPNELSFLKNGIESLIDDLLVKEYQSSSSSHFGGIGVRAKIFSYKDLSWELPPAFLSVT